MTGEIGLVFIRDGFLSKTCEYKETKVVMLSGKFHVRT